MAHRERHRTERIGWLRAAVLGANDGILSTASLVVGVAASQAGRAEVLVAGVAGLVAGAISMAAGEYVSVSSQADTEAADIAKERHELATMPAAEEDELTGIYVERGLEPALYALASRATVPVSIDGVPQERLPGALESTVYFVVSEALANVAKYAHAANASVAVRVEDGLVRVEVADDGVGGADAGRGSGLRGLEDRVAVLDGRLSVHSPPGLGTTLRAELPFRERRFARATVKT